MPCPACGYEHGVGAWPCPQCGRVPDASRWSLGVTLAGPRGRIAQAGADVTPVLSAEAGPSGAAEALAPGLDGQPHVSATGTEPARISATAPAATPLDAPHSAPTKLQAVAREQIRSLELPFSPRVADFLSGVGLGLVPVLIVTVTIVASSRLSAPASTPGILAGYAVAGATWVATIIAMIVLITHRHLRFIGYGLLTVIVLLPVLGAATWLLILLTVMRG
jgi:hypothetical protein